ncbi:Hypothetical predicted protein [Pelobates cultripes]|uniref:Uncharacterized protein n=1 Tax=Pelobates cultripes TaxID=61616 RepID=A0AAD1VWP6_PELCU|nr:Hypothetical predicted protein [Pelobates cultripes]
MADAARATTRDTDATEETLSNAYTYTSRRLDQIFQAFWLKVQARLQTTAHCSVPRKGTRRMKHSSMVKPPQGTKYKTTLPRPHYRSPRRRAR